MASTEPLNYIVSSFQELVETPFCGKINALCWARTLAGDFAELVHAATLVDNITVLDPEELEALQLSNQGQLAREVLLRDFNLLKAHGASPNINIIKCYEQDDAYPFFPTDVYSYHVDRSPIPTDTFLCTYYGEASDFLPDGQSIQKVLVPEIRAELKKLYSGAPEGFDLFLREHFFDLHYMPQDGATPVNLGLGNLWKLAVDHPVSKVPACVHRAPREKGKLRLLTIC